MYQAMGLLLRLALRDCTHMCLTAVTVAAAATVAMWPELTADSDVCFVVVAMVRRSMSALFFDGSWDFIAIRLAGDDDSLLHSHWAAFGDPEMPHFVPIDIRAADLLWIFGGNATEHCVLYDEAVVDGSVMLCTLIDIGHSNLFNIVFADNDW